MNRQISKPVCLLILVFMLLCTIAGRAYAQEKLIIIAADDWCPVNCSPVVKDQGVGIEMARAIFEPLGYTVKYITMPWTEALERVASGSVDAVIGGNQTDNNALVYPQTPVGTVADNIYTLSANPLNCEDMESLRNLRMGVVEGYGYHPLLADFIESQKDIPDAIQKASGAHALLENIQKLEKGQVNAIAEIDIVMAYTLNLQQINDTVHSACAFPSENIYLAFSPVHDNAQGLAKIFDTGMAKLKASGKLKEIYARYGLAL